MKKLFLILILILVKVLEMIILNFKNLIMNKFIICNYLIKHINIITIIILFSG
jgi:hypothetical protein